MSVGLQLQRRRALVIGSGLGGLSAAIHLRLAGRDVTVLEALPVLGGKAGESRWKGYRFDTGPSVLTIPRVLDDLFAAAGRRREDYLQLVPVEPGCRYRWPDGTVFDAPGTLPAFREAIARDFPGELAGFDRFARHAARLWEVSWPVFLSRPLDAATLLSTPPRYLRPALALLRPGTLSSVVRAHFREPKLIQLFERFATYNGSDPHRMPQAFNVIAHAELAFGSWSAKGGIRAVVDALARLASELGVELRTGMPVERVVFGGDGAVLGVDLRDGTHLAAPEVVVNQDAATAMAGPLLAAHPHAAGWRRRLARVEPSGGGYVVLAAIDRVNPALASHNVWFSGDYPREFREQFAEGVPLADPTVYISVPARHDPASAPEGREGWFVLVNAPSLRGCPEWPKDYGERLLAGIARRLPGFDPTQVLWREERSPAWFRKHLACWEGSLYGPSSNPLLSAFLRVRNRGPAAGLSFAGGSAHPGGGMPLVLLSGRLAAGALVG